MSKLKYKPVIHDHDAFLKNALRRKEFRETYTKLEMDYTLTREMLAARYRSGLSQQDVADLMGTSKSAVSRLETGKKHSPSLSTLQNYAHAVGCRLEIKLIRNFTGCKKRLQPSPERTTD